MESTTTGYIRIIIYISSGVLHFVSWYSMVETIVRPLVNEPPPLNSDYNRDPNIKALKKETIGIMGII